ncbi:MAG: translation initiation factor IF-2 [Candidatus Nealsonbacteria bacterium]|nr:MAG: translation initiation factor IF-2 [Candidatus Nealsonbacteria bacterium]
MEGEEKNLIAKPPVVVVLGHVDHGKTTILDYIRKTNVAEKESGGITQHIGAYEIEHKGKKITFIDTPGHEAFSTMRSRGAKVADIAILVVDATDGVKAQTKEAINFIKKAGIPMVVAINKIDKPGAQPEIVKSQLAQKDVLVESLGGKIPSQNVSAKTGEGIEELLETILLVAEMEQLKADLSKEAEGTVIESCLDPKKGPIATLLLTQGILKKGDILATPSAFGRVKSLTDFQGNPVDQTLPSQPVSVLGFETPPGVGEKFKVYKNQEEALRAIRKEEKKAPEVISIEPGKKVLNIILKTDVLGTGEAIVGALKNLPQEKVALRILKAEVGNINIGDIKLAESGKGIVFGFRVDIEETARVYAQQKKIRWKVFEVIYELVQEVRREMERVLEPEIKRIELGKVKVLALFKKSKEGQVVGGKVFEGEIEKGGLVEVLREEEVIGKGKIKNLQQEKKDVQKVGKGKECGILFQGEGEIEEGDVLVVFREERRKGEL